MTVKHPNAFTLLGLTFLAVLFLHTSEAEARTTCRSIGLTYNRQTGTCNYSRSSIPRHRGRGNSGCAAKRPEPKDVSGFSKANARIPYMRNEIFNYVTKLKSECRGLRLESTYRDCIANSSARGMQRSRHLCGGAADTSGCPSTTSKTMAAKICRASGLHFIDEGGSRYPHCQIQGHCN